MPTTGSGYDRICRFRPPGAALIWADRVMGLEDPIDNRPCGFNRVLACEERPIAMHGIAQEPLVRRFFSRLSF
jgi:hypothetical protein